MQLLTTKHFNGYVLDCYVEPNGVGDFWATSEQIGQLLGYVDPDVAIRKIHMRNKERLDKFSTSTKLVRVEGERTVTREVRLYSFKGLLEICRYSNQPVANAVMDVLWDIADEIRRTGEYKTKTRRSPRSFMKDAELIIDKTFKCKTHADCQAVIALDKVFQSANSYSVLDVAELQPELPLSRSEELWEHIVSTFDIGELFSLAMLQKTFGEEILSSRQIRRYLSSFVASHKLNRHGNRKSTEYSR